METFISLVIGDRYFKIYLLYILEHSILITLLFLRSSIKPKKKSVFQFF